MSERAPAVVFIVDDDMGVREALERLLASVGFRVETFRTAEEFSRRERADAPACLILDVRLPGLSGLDLQRELSETESPIPIVFITGHGDVPMSVQAMKAGAVDFLMKPFRDEQLLDAVERAIERDGAERRRRAELAELRTRYQRLTPRERQVLARVTAGLLNKQVAAELGTSEIMVKVHRAHVMRKMRARSLVDLVKMVERLGIPAVPRQ
jgi:FixJ family two-component response regulator